MKSPRPALIGAPSLERRVTMVEYTSLMLIVLVILTCAYQRKAALVGSQMNAAVVQALQPPAEDLLSAEYTLELKSVFDQHGAVVREALMPFLAVLRTHDLSALMEIEVKRGNEAFERGTAQSMSLALFLQRQRVSTSNFVLSVVEGDRSENFKIRFKRSDPVER